ncbi:helix-turn-helix transcriptional regulator [Paenibacillus senegalimassiliensis]|uniref:helix-turn-helix transcriptional regulator n=1 Tax=Paenibacillus senegalimassiliensis TaxID=1737426 RepID=UPI001E3ED3DC|nr:AraC family transcriptional regulator [Paenibacillus senegalimassiliensis]
MATDHYHREYELYYLFSGQRNYFIKEDVYQVQSGDLVFIDSHAVHKTSDSGAPHHERIVLYFSPSYFDDLTTEERDLLLSPFLLEFPLLRLNYQEQQQIEGLLGTLLTELNEQQPGYRLRITQLAGELLLYTARSLLKRESLPRQESSSVQRKISEIVRYINLHFAEPLELEELSLRFYISKSYLSRMFKQVTGFGFAEYVNLTRVKEAERLLRETDYSITHVSELSGFDNFSHFGKMFKRLTGVTPREYRRGHQNKVT